MRTDMYDKEGALIQIGQWVELPDGRRGEIEDVRLQYGKHHVWKVGFWCYGTRCHTEMYGNELTVLPNVTLEPVMIVSLKRGLK